MATPPITSPLNWDGIEALLARVAALHSAIWRGHQHHSQQRPVQLIELEQPLQLLSIECLDIFTASGDLGCTIPLYPSKTNSTDLQLHDLAKAIRLVESGQSLSRHTGPLNTRAVSVLITRFDRYCGYLSSPYDEAEPPNLDARIEREVERRLQDLRTSLVSVLRGSARREIEAAVDCVQGQMDEKLVMAMESMRREFEAGQTTSGARPEASEVAAVVREEEKGCHESDNLLLDHEEEAPGAADEGACADDIRHRQEDGEGPVTQAEAGKGDRGDTLQQSRATTETSSWSLVDMSLPNDTSTEAAATPSDHGPTDTSPEKLVEGGDDSSLATTAVESEAATFEGEPGREGEGSQQAEKREEELSVQPVLIDDKTDVDRIDNPEPIITLNDSRPDDKVEVDSATAAQIVTAYDSPERSPPSSPVKPPMFPTLVLRPPTISPPAPTPPPLTANLLPPSSAIPTPPSIPPAKVTTPSSACSIQPTSSDSSIFEDVHMSVTILTSVLERLKNDPNGQTEYERVELAVSVLMEILNGEVWDE